MGKLDLIEICRRTPISRPISGWPASTMQAMPSCFAIARTLTPNDKKPPAESLPLPGGDIRGRHPGLEIDPRGFPLWFPRNVNGNPVVFANSVRD